jgi:hypothetical protein
MIKALLAILLFTVLAPAPAQAKPPTAAQLQAQLKKVTAERDELKDRLTATESLQEDLAAAQQSRDMARSETDAMRKELEQMKAALADNQGSADTILNELRKTKSDLASARAALETLRRETAERKEKAAAPAAEGALVAMTPDITPANPLNLKRITPKVKKVAGVVVVNVLISESGDVLDARLLQGLVGNNEFVTKANAACVEAAKRVVFDPARAADGKTKVRVWQGVGFYLD